MESVASVRGRRLSGRGKRRAAVYSPGPPLMIGTRNEGVATVSAPCDLGLGIPPRRGARRAPRLAVAPLPVGGMPRSRWIESGREVKRKAKELSGSIHARHEHERNQLEPSTPERGHSRRLARRASPVLRWSCSANRRRRSAEWTMCEILAPSLASSSKANGDRRPGDQIRPLARLSLGRQPQVGEDGRGVPLASRHPSRERWRWVGSRLRNPETEARRAIAADPQCGGAVASAKAGQGSTLRLVTASGGIA